MTETQNTQANCYIRRNITLGANPNPKFCISTPAGARISPWGTKEEAIARFERLPKK